jgi:hypothetical protein
MKLRTGKTIASGIIDSTPTVTTIDKPIYTEMHQQPMPKTSFAVLSGLINYAKTGTTIEKMKKISLIYDIVLADKGIRCCPIYDGFVNALCKEAIRHMHDINRDNVISLLDTDELIAAHKHFSSILEKFIDSPFHTKPADYNDYSYHYDIMRKIGYNEAAEKRADIFNYAYTVDYDEDLVGDYIRNEVTVYELYAMVTYNTYTALPNSVSYDYCVNEVLSWYKRPIRE